MARRRRPALLPGDADARSVGDPGHPVGDRQVAPPSFARGHARFDRYRRGVGNAVPRRAVRMMPNERFERQLPELLTELAAPRTPDYVDDLFGLTAATRQRPAWTFLERWLPMVDIARQPILTSRVPMRTIGLGLLLVALI